MAEDILEIEEYEDTDQLIQMLREGDYLKKIKAANALTKLRDEKSIFPLILALGHSSYYVQVAASDILIKMGDMAIEPIMRHWAAYTKEIQVHLVYILWRIGGNNAIEALVRLMNDKENYVRTDAIFALGQIKGKTVIEPLLKALKDDNFAVRVAAYRALEDIDANDIDMQLIIQEVETQCINLENEALSVMRKIGEAKSMEFLPVKIDGSETSRESASITIMNQLDINGSPMIFSLYYFCLYVWHMMEIIQRKAKIN